MITARLQGGIGNVLFQIATAEALAYRNGGRAVFDLENCYTPLQGNPADKYSDTVYRDLNKMPLPQHLPVYKEQTLRYQEIPYSEPLCLDGYFQSEKYFEDCKEHIKSLFRLCQESIKEVDDPITTAVCVRRGDYLKLPDIYPLPTIEYYQEAMSLIGEGAFIFVSDDIEWCKENFSGENIFFCPLTDDVEALSFIARCTNVILANSTFGWWGAWMGETIFSKIIAPKEWFTKENGLDSSDIIPERWTRL